VNTASPVWARSACCEASATVTINDNFVAHLLDAYKIAYGEIVSFVTTREFQLVLLEMYELEAQSQPQFVINVLLNEEALRERDVFVPPNLIIQRSAFGDKRPTLFCVTRMLPPGMIWEKATITFDMVDESCISTTTS
jgi:hypothetical protein